MELGYRFYFCVNYYKRFSMATNRQAQKNQPRGKPPERLAFQRKGMKTYLFFSRS